MMKHCSKVCYMMCLVMLLFGCGNNYTGEMQENKGSADERVCETIDTVDTDDGRGFLPSRIERIKEGGIIPKGCEGKRIEEGFYSNEMFWGTWVPEENDLNEGGQEEETIVLEEEQEDIAIKCWPKRLTFSPAWAGVLGDDEFSFAWESPDTKGRELALYNQWAEMRNNSLVFGSRFYNYEIGAVNDPLGLALESNGYGFGKVTYEKIEPKESDDELTPIVSMSLEDEIIQRKIAYAVSGNVLAVGITEMSLPGWGEEEQEEGPETNITEIDYEFAWEGERLSLTYNSKTVVYVPEQMKDEEHSGIDIRNAGPVNKNEVVGSIYGITFTSNEEGVSYSDENGSYHLTQAIMNGDVHEGYRQANFQFDDKGGLAIGVEDGDTYEFDYLYSGDSLTLISDGVPYIYSLFTYALPSSAGEVTHTIYADGNELRLDGSEDLNWYVNQGFQTDYDLNQLIAPCQVTDEITLNYQGADLVVKVVNPCENPIKLGECIVCYVYLGDTGGILTKNDGTQINQTTYEEVEFLYEAPYEKTDNLLRYKGTASGMVLSYRNSLLDHIMDSQYRILLDVYGDVEVVYDFQDGILKDYRIEMPALLYNGLQDNMDASVLANMQPAMFAGYIEVRDTVLDRLKAAFQDAGIEVGINESTGEVVMANDVLFEVDQTALSDEGKKYIDNFVGVYASVIAAEEYSDYIAEVHFEGHTDSTGSFAYNMDLSQARADAVLNYCLSSDENGMDQVQREKLEQLSTTRGYSYSDLVYDEAGIEDKDASRRVAIKFYVKMPGD